MGKDLGGYIWLGIMLYCIFGILITYIILSFFRINEKDKNLSTEIENLSLKEQITHMRYLFSKCKMMTLVFILYLILSYYIVSKIITTLSSDKHVFSYFVINFGIIIYLFIFFITYIILNNITLTLTDEEKKAPNGIENLSLKGQIVHILYLFNKSKLLKILTVLYILLVYYINILFIRDINISLSKK